MIALVLVFVVFKPFGDKKLSHTAVEKYVASTFSQRGVTCNDGKDVTVKKGATFTCMTSDKTDYKVTITDTGKATYTVQPQS